jgi:hypothetical protein
VRTCSIEPTALTLAEQWIVQRRADWERRFDRLDAYLANLPPETDKQE